MRLGSFYEELKRRHVFRVTGVYLVAAYAVVQGVSTVFPLLGFSQAAATAILIIAILGIPVVILLAWVFDITPEGVRRTAAATADVEGAPPLDQQIEAHRRRLAARGVGFVGVGVLVALVGFAAFGRWGLRDKPVTVAHIESIGVLPFANLSGQADQDFFTDGVTEEIINRLSQIEGLQVPGRTSSFQFKQATIDLAEIARRLNVQAILEGSVRRDSNNVRITARLVDARTGTQIWGNQYDRQVSSVFAVQDEIASAIADALKLQIASSTPEIGTKAHGTTNAQAQDLYYKGLEAWNDRTDEQLRVALQYFEKAAHADTAYALAYAGLAKTYAVLPTFGRYPTLDALRNGSAAAARALSLDPDLGDAHAALGQLAQNLEWDLSSALRSYKRAVLFNPKDATAHQWYAEALMMSGDYAKAAEEVDLALDFEPLSPAARNVRGYLTMLRGDLPGAVRIYQNLAREAPGYRLGQINYAFTALAAKDYTSAVPALIAALPEHAPNVGLLIAAASGQGDSAGAASAIRDMEATVPASVAILLYAAIGASDRALALMQKTFDSGEDANFPYILPHPLLTPLRQQPVFQRIVRTLGVAVPA